MGLRACAHGSRHVRELRPPQHGRTEICTHAYMEVGPVTTSRLQAPRAIRVRMQQAIRHHRTKKPFADAHCQRKPRVVGYRDVRHRPTIPAGICIYTNMHQSPVVEQPLLGECRVVRPSLARLVAHRQELSVQGGHLWNETQHGKKSNVMAKDGRTTHQDGMVIESYMSLPTLAYSVAYPFHR